MLKSLDKTSIDIFSPININEINSYDTKEVKFNDPIVVDKISASYLNEEIFIESPLTSSDTIKFNCPVDFTSDVHLLEDNLQFKQFSYNDKFKNHGNIFLGIDSIFTGPKNNTDINSFEIESNDTLDLEKFGNSYQFVPTNGLYMIAKVTSDKNEWYMLVMKSNKTNRNDKIRIITTADNDYINNDSLTQEIVYELISSNSIYKDIYKTLNDTVNDTTSRKPYVTIGFSNPSGFSTITNCKVELKLIPVLNNQNKFGSNNLIYFISLY